MLLKIWQNKIFSGEICYSVNELENQKWEPLTIMINRFPQIPAAISWLERLSDFSKVVAIDLQKFGTTTWMCQTLVIVLQMKNNNKSLFKTYFFSLLTSLRIFLTVLSDYIIDYTQSGLIRNGPIRITQGDFRLF